MDSLEKKVTGTPCVSTGLDAEGLWLRVSLGLQVGVAEAGPGPQGTILGLRRGPGPLLEQRLALGLTAVLGSLTPSSCQGLSAWVSVWPTVEAK